MTQTRKDFAAAQAGVGPDAVDDATELAVLRDLVADLEHQKVTLTEGLENRQRIGFVTGVLAQRYGLQPDEAWGLLTRASQNLNIKAHRVAEVLLAVYTGRLAHGDVPLAVRIADQLPEVPAGSTPQASSGLDGLVH